MTRLPVLLLALPLLLAAAAHAARDTNLLRLEMDRAAGEFHTWLAGRAVRVEPFTCPDAGPANGRILTHLFKEALQRRGVSVRPDAAVAIRGRFRDHSDPRSPLPCVRVHLEGADTGGGRRSLEVSLHEPSLAALLFARAAPAGARPAMVHTRDGEVFARAGSPLALSIRKAPDPEQTDGPNDYTAMTRCRVKDGLVHADLKRGDVYGVLLFNRSDHDVAVLLSLDGLDTFAHRPRRGEPGAADGGYHVVRKGKSLFVRAWADGTAFRVGERTPAGPGGVGILTAQFFRCWPRPGAEGTTERVEDSPGGISKQPDGRPRVVPYVVGPLLETVPVLYGREPN